MDFPNGFEGFGAFSDGESLKEKFQKQRGKMSRGKKVLLIVLIALLLLGIFAGQILNFVMQVWQIQEIGSNFTDVFWKSFLCRLAVSASGFLLVFAVTSINLFLLRKLALVKYSTAKLLGKKWPYLVAAVVLSFVFGGVFGKNAYIELLSALNATEFGTQDPLFLKDIGYYIFTRPFLNTVVTALKSVFILQIVLIAVLYFVVFFSTGMHTVKEMIKKERGALCHVLFNVLVYYISMVVSYQLTAEGLLYKNFSGNGDVTGAGFIEANIWLPYYRIAPYLILLAVVLAAVFLWRKKYAISIGAVLAVPAIYICVLAAS
ncbi:MAG: UPF0182 family protein, partial [Clostridia bacterium]|nr:UPF0182 family protein [Clostridia bacterium]